MARPRKHPLPPPVYHRVRCIWSNVWTSKGKLMRGEEAELPADEAQGLDARDAVKLIRESDDA